MELRNDGWGRGPDLYPARSLIDSTRECAFGYRAQRELTLLLKAGRMVT